MSVVPRKLELPLFITTRNSIRQQRMENMKQYIRDQTLQYTRKCEEDKVPISATHKKLLETIGVSSNITQTMSPPLLKRTEKRMREVRKCWTPPPNMYDTTHKPYGHWKGSFGAFWSKKDYGKDSFAKKYEQFDGEFFCRPTSIDEMNSRNAYFRGKFLTNPRHRRPTARSAVSSVASCYKNPNDPAPGQYNIEHGDIQYEALKKLKNTKKLKMELPFKFATASTVPLHETSFYLKNTSYTPGPASYGIPFNKVCACKPKLRYFPNLYVLVDQQKRLKFRRKKWFRVRTKLYCDPSLKHIPGNGWTNVFKMSRKEKMKLDASKKKRYKHTSVKQFQTKLYANAAELDLINNTKHKIDNTWLIRPRLPIKIKFFAIIKAKVKKKPKQPKKVGFSSGAPRFEGDKPRVSFTEEQVKAVKAKLPPSLRLYNKPVTREPLEEIKPRLYYKKKSLKKVLTKKPFLFAGIPGPCMLLGDTEVRVPQEEAKSLYRTVDGPVPFFRDSAEHLELFTNIY